MLAAPLAPMLATARRRRGARLPRRAPTGATERRDSRTWGAIVARPFTALRQVWHSPLARVKHAGHDHAPNRVSLSVGMTTGAVRLVNAAPPMGGVAGGRLECVLQASLPEHGLAGPEEACDEPEQHVRPRWPI